MLYTVTCYKETGFSRGNIPSSPAVIQNAASVTLQANQVWKMQDLFLSRVKLAMNWENASKIDYMKIGDKYYTVEGVEMVSGSDNVADFTIALDPINSAGGVSGFTIIDGWVERASPRTDVLFDNIMDEPWSPKNEMVSEPPLSIIAGNKVEQQPIIGSTIDLMDDVGAVAKTAIDSATSADVTFPYIPMASHETHVFIRGEPFNLTAAPELPGGALFDASNETVLRNVSYAFGLSMQDGITSSYLVPKGYIGSGFSPNNGRWLAIGSDVISKSIDRPYRYGTYVPKNNKVFALFNNYSVFGISSFESKTFEAKDIANSDTQPSFVLYADLSPAGRPYFQPKTYHGRATLVFQEAVAGSNWLNNQITFNSSGQNIMANASYYNTQFNNLFNYIYSSRRAAVGRIPSMLSNIGTLYSSLNGIGKIKDLFQIDAYKDLAQFGFDIAMEEWGRDVDYRTTVRNADFSFMESQVKAPDFYFNSNVSTSLFVDNGFCVIQSHLSEGDMERFDRFLTMYGYADSRKLDKEDFTSHTHFNFVKASNVAIKGPTMMLCNMISDYFAGGVRLWHELPNQEAMTNNPIKS